MGREVRMVLWRGGELVRQVRAVGDGLGGLAGGLGVVGPSLQAAVSCPQKSHWLL